jgi:hypothetical protein
MREVDQLKDAAGAYRRWALEARRDYILLRLRQDLEIRALYIRAADSIARKLRRIKITTPSGIIYRNHLEEMERALRLEAEKLTDSYRQRMKEYIVEAVNAGTGYSKAITTDLFKKAGLSTEGVARLFAGANTQAVEACWARTKKGLYLSDRIWRQRDKFNSVMRDIIQESVAVGQDATKTARMIEQYVRQGKKTLAKDYPNMMKRMKGRIPGDICYEALRLARTEMTAAFGEGSISAAQVSPSYLGMKWVLSHSHPVVDICDALAARDEGLGKGVFSPGNEPSFPAHPNCLVPDQAVITEGGHVNIQDVAIGTKVLTGAGNWKTVLGTSKKYCKGKVLKFTTKTGKQIVVTPEHKLATQKGWAEANTIKKGDKILVSL